MWFIYRCLLIWMGFEVHELWDFGPTWYASTCLFLVCCKIVRCSFQIGAKPVGFRIPKNEAIKYSLHINTFHVSKVGCPEIEFDKSIWENKMMMEFLFDDCLKKTWKRAVKLEMQFGKTPKRGPDFEGRYLPNFLAGRSLEPRFAAIWCWKKNTRVVRDHL